MAHFLVILEVSQKQAYIFSSNKLRDNIINSANIAHVTSAAYFREVAPDLYSDGNLVYSGGGHTVLEFPSLDAAQAFVKQVTRSARRDYPGLELFAKVYDAGEDPSGKDLKALAEALERKKSLRSASFHHGSFGVEDMDTNTRKPVPAQVKERKIPPEDDALTRKMVPDGFTPTYEFGSLGKSNFVAVVHIDGNAMGKRVEELREKHSTDNWEAYKAVLRSFSDAIDADFKAAFAEMCQTVARDLTDPERKLGDKVLAYHGADTMFPVRRIITAGDDICFVADGSIGLECARLFIEKLASKQNEVDGKGYAACAGVVLVHQNYPFYRAYELAEMLCSNAKKLIADLGGTEASARSCAVDWHIEFGELGESLEEIREQYLAADGSDMTMRPYLIGTGKTRELLKKDSYRDYGHFRKKVALLQDAENSFARSKLKGLRPVISQGVTETNNYIKSSLLEDLLINGIYDIDKEITISMIGTGEGLEKDAYLTLSDGVKHSAFFDAIECMDDFIALSEEGENK